MKTTQTISTILFLSLLTFLLFSCSKKNENSSRPSKGKINSISVVIDDQLWNGVVGDSIRNKFASPVAGLTKEEPIFDINQYPISVMEGFVTKSRTIIVVKMGTENSFVINKNQYATPQNVIHITGKTLTDLLAIIEKSSPKIISIIEEAEIKAHQKRLLNDSLLATNEIQKLFRLTLNIPKTYSYVEKNDNFIWLIKEFPSGSANLLISQLPFSTFNKENAVLEKAIKLHDSIGALYIKDKDSCSNQYMDKSYPLYLSKIILDGKLTYEIKGTWRLKDSFMFGSSINYFIMDSINQRIIYIEGFCYIPSGQRRDCKHELEAIIKGVILN